MNCTDEIRSNSHSANVPRNVMEKLEGHAKPAPTRSAILSTLLTVAGMICVSLAIAGIVLPLLPTTPFLLLAATCFARSSPRLDDWLHNNRLFGPYLRAYRAGHGIPLPAKVSIIVLLWISIAFSTIVAVPDRLWALRLVLVMTGLLVSIYVLRVKTYTRASEETRNM